MADPGLKRTGHICGKKTWPLLELAMWIKRLSPYSVGKYYQFTEKAKVHIVVKMHYALARKAD